MSYNKTVKDIEQYTGLDYHYILKCIRELPDVFTIKVIERGENNSILFDSNAFVLFDQIKQMKESNKSLKFMRSYFENTFNQNHQNHIKSVENENQNDLTKILLNKLEEANKEAFNAFKETIRTKDDQIKTLESKILLLTDGRTPEEVKKEHAEKEEKLFKLKQQVEELELMKLKEQKRQEILKELQSLEGKWFARKKRQELFTQFQNLSQI